MQMYEVSFQTHYEDVIDTGKILVCASDNQHAVDTVRLFLGVPASQSVITANRIKPSVYQLDRREIKKNKAARNRLDAVHELNQAHGLTRPPVENSPWVLGVTAGVRAVSESAAWQKLAYAILERTHHNSAVINGSVTELEMTCEQAAFRPKPSAIEKQAIYKEARFFSGGAARPR